MQITFTFDTSNKADLDLLNKITDFAAKVQDAQPEVAVNTGTTATGFNLSPEGSGVSEPEAEKAPAAPVKRTRKPKEEAPAPVAQPEPEPEPEAEAEAKTYTLDEVRAALQQFTAKSGVPAGIDLLKSFNAGRISELEADDYAAFVERCAA